MNLKITKINTGQIANPNFVHFAFLGGKCNLAKIVVSHVPAPTSFMSVFAADTHDASSVWTILGVIEDNKTAKRITTESTPDTDMEISCERNTMIPRRYCKSQKPQNKYENCEN